MSNVNQQIANLGIEERELLELLLDEEGVDLSHTLIIPEGRSSNRFPASFAQERLWFLQQIEPQNPFYNIAKALHLTGPLNLPAFQKSLDEIVFRHETLRTVFSSVDGQVQQMILEP